MEDINEILVKHFEGETSKQEEAALEAWKINNAKEYDILKKAWTGSALTASPVNFNTRKAWAAVHEKTIGDRPVISLFSNRARVYGMAAALLLIIGLVVLWQFGFHSAAESPELVFQNPGEPVKEVVLPDGSTVSLKQHAKLIYNAADNNQRAMALSGEAFFDVKKDPAHPFVIGTHQGTITVLGTSFNVDANDSASVVSVRTGIVKLASAAGSVLLKAGDMAAADKAGLTPAKKSDQNYLSWKTGEFVFEATPLPDIIKSLNKYYANRFECSSTTNCKITAHFKNNSVEEIEQTIELTCGNEAIHRGDKILFE